MFSIQSAANQFLSNLSGLEQRLNRSNQEVSSGLRVQTVSDDPASVAQIVQLNAQIVSNNQVKTNLGVVQTEVNGAEAAINTATQLMDHAVQLATEGSTSVSSTNRPQLAQQVGDILTEMQQLANTQVAGRYIFSGNSDQQPPYPNNVTTYMGSASTRFVKDSYGGSISIALTAQNIFDGGPGGTLSTSVFQSLTDLYNTLNSSTPVTGAQISNLQGAAAYLDAQQATYGDVQNRLTDALTTQGVLDSNLKAQLSSLQDADEAQAITQQQTDSTALTAAESAYAAFPKKSLFDYLA